MSPAPPALDVMVMTVATEVVTTSTMSYQPMMTGGKQTSRRTALGNEEPLELVGRDEEDGKLDTPKDQVADHALGCDADALRDMVRDVKVGWPDGPDDLGHGSRAGVGLDSMPEKGRDGTSDNGESREVPSERRTNGDWVGNVEPSTDHTVEDQRYGADQASKDDADNGLAPGQADGDDGGGSHPTLGVESITVSYQVN